MNADPRRLVDRAERPDEGAAMVSAILLTFILAGLSVLVLAMVVTQVSPTQFAQKNQRTIFAAETGVQAALGQIRAAAAPADFTGSVYGNLADLPCTVDGTVADDTGALRYDVDVWYFRDNPAGRDDTWLAANRLSCTPGSGTVQQPLFAVLSADGRAGTLPGRDADFGDRAVRQIYRFNVTNVNVAGGIVYSFGDQACLEADGTTANSTISYIARADCGTDDETQLWVYDDDYMIKLAFSLLPGQTPLCITGPNGSAPQQARLQPCLARTDPARWNQLWSWEGGARWRGENSAINNYSSITLNSGATSGNPVGRKLHVTANAASDQAWGSFNPDPRVGAGAAGISTRQVVNYLEFGRCFDVTNENTSSSFMIVYPCKQDPSPTGSKLLWNHKWYYSEPDPGQTSKGPQEIYVFNNSGTKFCLESPTSGSYPTLKACNSSNVRQTWTRYQDTGVYTTSYTITDYAGRCVSIGDKYNGSWSKIVVTSCNGEAEQKWNAPPENVSAQLDDYREVYD